MSNRVENTGSGGSSGVTSVAKQGGTPITGAVTISGGTGITLIESGQNIEIDALAGINYWTLSGNDLYNNSGDIVGINNTNPTYALDIYDAHGTGFDLGDSTTGLWNINNSGGAFFSGDTQIGAGLVDQGAQLDVANYLRVVGPDISPPVAGQGIEMTYDQGGSQTGFLQTYDRGGGGLLNTNLGDNNQLLLTSSGPVGIGTGAPIYALDINDNYGTGYDIGNSTVGRWFVSNNGSAEFANLSVPGVIGVQGVLTDGVSSGGSAGQILSATGGAAGTAWKNQYTAKGTTTLSSGTKAITISGLTSSNMAFVQLTAPGGTLGVGYKAVCTTNTLTITSVVAAGTTQTLDTSTLNYLVL